MKNACTLCEWESYRRQFQKTALIVFLALFFFSGQVTAQIYVDVSASGSNNGSTWANAYTNLQDAIDDLNATNLEIWVATGTYLPTRDKTGSATPSDNKTKTFYIQKNGVKIFGGYPSGGGSRNVPVNITVLSGDFNGDDVVTGSGSTLSITNNGENAFNVVHIDGTTGNGQITSATLLYGLRIQGGNNGYGYPWGDGGGVHNEGRGSGKVCSPSFTNCRISGNYAIDGGGMCNDGRNGGTSSPIITDCTLSGNLAAYGGGMYNSGNSGTSNPILTNCVLSGNSVSLDGGGMYNNGENGTSSPILIDCILSGNSAHNGGGMANFGENGTSSPSLSNCTLNGNSANIDGGGMSSDGSYNGVCSPILTSCTISNNLATYGGGMYNKGEYGTSSPSLTNCKLVNNSASSSGGGMYNLGYNSGGTSSPILKNCTLSGNSANYQGHEMYNQGTYGTCNPSITNCIFWTNNNASIYNADATGNMSYSIFFDGTTDGIPTAPMGMALYTGVIEANPVFTDAVNGDYSIQSCSPAVNTGDGTSGSSSNSTTVDIAGNPRFYNNSTVDMGAYEFQGTFAYCCPFTTAIYVDVSNVSGVKDGITWATAFTDLQDAIDNSACGVDILVAAGTYYPTKDKFGNHIPSDNRNKTFYIQRNATKIYGGYPTGGGTRNVAVNMTVLSGDFNGDDVVSGSGSTLSITNNGENAINVVHIDGTTIHGNITDLTLLDGLKISGGHSPDYYYGGGVHNDGNGNGRECNPSFTNCIISNNVADYGGGIFNNGSNLGVCSPILTSCTISNNLATYGGGMYNEKGSSPVLTNCILVGNSASNSGGGMYNYGKSHVSSPKLTNCTLRGNSAYYGGGMYNNGSNGYGNSSPILTNCVLSGNSATSGGGALYNYINLGGYSNPVLKNCTVSGNSAGNGGAMYNYFNNGSSNPSLINCIIWSNGSTPIYNNNADGTFVSYSIYDDNTPDGLATAPSGTTFGYGVIEVNPVFYDAFNHDYSIQSCSPALNIGDGILGLSANTTTTDIAGNPRFYNNGTIDLGAYEFQGTYAYCCPFAGAIYVDKSNVSGNTNGRTWATAYTDLQQAINNWPCGLDIHVAAGTYHPTMNKYGYSYPTDNRTKTFYISSDSLKIYGGYPAGGGIRNVAANPTILSGDFNGDDVVSGSGSTLSIANNVENAFNVVHIDGTTIHGSITSATLLDGFTIQGGNADVAGVDNAGGGVFNNGGAYGRVCSPSFTNCTLTGNSANFGGGMFNGGGNNGASSPVLTNCRLSGNLAYNHGGGIYNSGTSSPIMTNCSLVGNKSIDEGGGMSNFGFNGTSSPILTNCTLVSNSSNSGGGMYNSGFNGISSPILTNCTLAGNSASIGSAILNHSHDTNSTCSPSLTNCILWSHNNSPIFNTNATGTTISYSIYADSIFDVTPNPPVGVTFGTGVIEANPLFTDSTNGDYSLQSCSPAINAGNNAAIPSGVSTDFAGNPRQYNSGMVDLGAFEYQGAFVAIILEVTINSDDIDNTIAPGTSVTFTATTTNGGTAPGYQWKLNGGNVGGNQSTYTSTTLADHDKVTCMMTSSAFCTNPMVATSNEIIMRVCSNDVPVITGVAVTQPSCTVLTGSIIITATGVSDLEYSLTPSVDSSWQTSNAFNNLSARKYRPAVRLVADDACTLLSGTTGAITINRPFSLNVSKIDATCSNKSNGSITPLASGGIQPYTYSWNTGATSSKFRQLAPGSYSVTVTDNQGCSLTDSVILGPSPIVVTVSHSGTSHPITATVTATGGSPDYSYNISGTTAYVSSNVFTGLHPRAYTFRAKDTNGCIGSTRINLGTPVPLDNQTTEERNFDATKEVLTLFPNPTNRVLNIQWIGEEKLRNGKITITNAFGQEMLNREIAFDENGASIQVDYLPQGTYRLIFRNEDGTFAAKQFVVWKD